MYIRHSTDGRSNVENPTSEEGRFECWIFDGRLIECRKSDIPRRGLRMSNIRHSTMWPIESKKSDPTNKANPIEFSTFDPTECTRLLVMDPCFIHCHIPHEKIVVSDRLWANMVPISNRAFSCSNVHAKWWIHCLLISLRCHLSYATSMYDRPKPFCGLFLCFLEQLPNLGDQALNLNGIFSHQKAMLYQHTKFRSFHCFENYRSSVTKTTVTSELNVRLSWNFDTYRLKFSTS